MRGSPPGLPLFCGSRSPRGGLVPAFIHIHPPFCPPMMPRTIESRFARLGKHETIGLQDRMKSLRNQVVDPGFAAYRNTAERQGIDARPSGEEPTDRRPGAVPEPPKAGCDAGCLGRQAHRTMELAPGAARVHHASSGRSAGRGAGQGTVRLRKEPVRAERRSFHDPNRPPCQPPDVRQRIGRRWRSWGSAAMPAPI